MFRQDLKDWENLRDSISSSMLYLPHPPPTRRMRGDVTGREDSLLKTVTIEFRLRTL